ncbi:MAG TPA: alanine:cation symporter family protein, partial [Rhabdochlamydiaceae bacterium]|nr:alanine:cation symporter family protein [Rhabdochlamydiaceae bacterium]
WACCAEKAVGFLWGTKHVRKFQYLYIALIPVGAITHVDIVWALADISISLMLVTNLIGVAGLSKQVIGESREFFSLQASNHG